MSGDGGSDVHGAAAARLLPAQLLLYRLATLRVTMELRDVTVSAHDVACDVSVALGLHVDFDLRVEVDALRVDLQQAVGAVEQPQLTGLVLFLSLLPAERHLGRHDPLPLGDERALGAHTVPPAAVALVALQGRHHPVVTAAGTFRGARVAVRGPQEHGGGRAVVMPRTAIVFGTTHPARVSVLGGDAICCTQGDEEPCRSGAA